MSTRIGSEVVVLMAHLPPLPSQVGIAKFADISGRGHAAGVDDVDAIRVRRDRWCRRRLRRCCVLPFAKLNWPTSVRYVGGAVPEPETETTAEALTYPPTVITSG